MALFDLGPEELRAYRPDVAEPEDFDEFWAGTLAEARGHDLGLRLEPVETGLRLVDVYDVTFAGYAGQPVRAWLTLPRGVEGPLPAVVGYNGYGGGRGLAHEHLGWAAAGYAELFVDTRGQGSTWGTGGDTPDPEGSGPALPGSMTRGILDPRTYYYRRLFTDAARAVEAVRAVPQVDPSRVAVCGTSQGGGMALAVGGLVPDVAAVMTDVPFLCHFERAVNLTDSDPYGEVRRYLAVHRDAAAAAFRTLSYVDGVNFARRAQAPALFSVALMDAVCPPSTVYAAYNHYGSRAASAPAKAIEVYPFNGHEGGIGYQWAKQIAWLGSLLGG
ncbi:acetylxylan esterase [Kineococcus sp. NUM-3379]